MKENKIFDETDVFRKSKSKRVKNNNKKNMINQF